MQTHLLQAVAKHNGSVWLHAVFSTAGADPEARDELPPGSVFTKSVPLVRFMAPRRNRTGVNLLTAENAPMTAPKRRQRRAESPAGDGGANGADADGDGDSSAAAKLPLPHWKPNATLAIADHFSAYGRSQVPPQMRDLFEPADAEGEHYLPIAHFDEFWLLRDKLVPLNASVLGTQLPLHLEIKTASIWWLQLQRQVEQSFSMQISMGLSAEGEADEVKRIFLEGNPVLLGITMVRHEDGEGMARADDEGGEEGGAGVAKGGHSALHALTSSSSLRTTHPLTTHLSPPPTTTTTTHTLHTARVAAALGLRLPRVQERRRLLEGQPLDGGPVGAQRARQRVLPARDPAVPL